MFILVKSRESETYINVNHIMAVQQIDSIDRDYKSEIQMNCMNPFSAEFKKFYSIESVQEIMDKISGWH